MRKLAIFVGLAMIVAGFGGLLPAAALAANVYSVEEFNRLESQWSQFLRDKTLLKVEGRYSAMAPTVIRFKHCKLWFRPAVGTKFPKSSGKTETIEVVGRLGMRRKKLTFVVERFSERLSDEKSFVRKQNRIGARDEQSWYALGKWARKRGKFYKDASFLKHADDAFLKGILIEREKLTANRAEGLFALADKANRFKLPDRQRHLLIFEGCQWLWKSRPSKKPLKVTDLLAKMADDLPGSETPLTAIDPKLEASYRDDPLATYQTSNPKEFRKLNRLFYRDVLLAKIVSKAARDFSNGFDVAEKIERQIPEKQILAEEYREKQLAFETSHANLLNRRQVLLLAERLRKRHRPGEARKALGHWLEAKEKQYRPQGPSGLTRLAEEYASLLGDRKRAASLLIEAAKSSPESKEIRERLERLGYRFRNGQWSSNEDRKNNSQEEELNAMRDGLIKPGMTPDEVWKALGGAPNAVARLVTSDTVVEVWSYGHRNQRRVNIHFERRRTRANSQAKVVRISQLRGR